ncbi:MAG: prolyl oligopeptidase family serine peptidase [Planctomycetota bacterium]|nr:prolyl oligopeptidase family serine peptidase [Planctomycetota bacterium]
MRSLAVLALTLSLAVSCSREETETPRQPMTFPARPVASLIGNHVHLFDVALSGTGPGQTMRMWVYLPPGAHREKSLPCVLIAPAGSNLITGMQLGEGDAPEHLPYAAAGFAVIAYELDGALPEFPKPDQEAAAVKAYVASKGGVLNAQTALDYIGERVPEVDPNRVYAAGHSSAGTVALVLAASDPRVKGAVAYAPAVNLRSFLGLDLVRTITRSIPKAEPFLEYGSPDRRVADFTSPVMLFAARDDNTISPQRVIDFANAMKDAGKTAELLIVESGGHYDAMMREGIPAGVAWLKKIDGAGR